MDPTLKPSVNPVHGLLRIGHRPRIKAIGPMCRAGCGMVVTLLSETEGARIIGEEVVRQGMRWLCFPMTSATPPGKKRHAEAEHCLSEIAAALEQGTEVFIHCSAGMHRTGMIAFALLRYMGVDAIRARGILKTLRPITEEAVGEARLRWGEHFARADRSSPGNMESPE